MKISVHVFNAIKCNVIQITYPVLVAIRNEPSAPPAMNDRKAVFRENNACFLGILNKVRIFN